MVRQERRLAARRRSHAIREAIAKAIIVVVTAVGVYTADLIYGHDALRMSELVFVHGKGSQ